MRGVVVSHNAVWTVPAPRRAELQKKRCSLLSRPGPTWPVGGGAGRPCRPASIRNAWSSSTRPGSRPTWLPCAAGPRRASACAASPLRATVADPDLPRRAALGRDHRTLHLRRSDQRPVLPRLCRAAAPAGPAARRHRRPRQSRQPQSQGPAPDAQGRRREALVSAALLTRSQPDRKGLLQDQALDAPRPEAHPGRPRALHRQSSSRPSDNPNAATTSKAPDMLTSKRETL